MLTYTLHRPTDADIRAWRAAVAFGAARDITWEIGRARLEIEVRLGADIRCMPADLAQRYCRVLKLIVA